MFVDWVFAPLLTQTGATKFRHGNAESEIKTSSNNIRTWQNCFRNIVSRFGYNLNRSFHHLQWNQFRPVADQYNFQLCVCFVENDKTKSQQTWWTCTHTHTQRTNCRLYTFWDRAQRKNRKQLKAEWKKKTKHKSHCEIEWVWFVKGRTTTRERERESVERICF